jgi:hypothetical protein
VLLAKRAVVWGGFTAVVDDAGHGADDIRCRSLCKANRKRTEKLKRRSFEPAHRLAARGRRARNRPMMST